MLPQDVWDRLMSGQLTPHQAVKEAEELTEARRPFNDELRRQLGESAADRERAQQERLRARLFGPQEPPRDEGGRFASRTPANGAGFDGGARGQQPGRGERQRVHDAIETLIEHRGNEIANYDGERG